MGDDVAEKEFRLNEFKMFFDRIFGEAFFLLATIKKTQGLGMYFMMVMDYAGETLDIPLNRLCGFFNLIYGKNGISAEKLIKHAFQLGGE